MINTEIVLWAPPCQNLRGAPPLRFWHGATRGLNPALGGNGGCAYESQPLSSQTAHERMHRPLEHSCTSRSPATVAAVLAVSPVRRRTVCPDASCRRRCCRRASCVRHQRRRQYQDFSRKPDALSDNDDSYDISVTSHSSPIYRSYIHRESKKQDTQLLAITSITII